MSEEKNVVLEKILADYGFKEGKIKLGDEEKSINDLEPDVQYNILKNIIGNDNKNDLKLNESEIAAVNFLRENDTTLNDFLNSEVDKEVLKAKQFYEFKNEDVDKMSDDMVYIKNLKDKNKDISDEDITRKLETAKSLESFSETTNDLRDVYKTEKELKVEKLRIEDDKIFDEKMEKQRKYIVDEVIPMDYISDWKVTDETKNELLEKILETTESKDGTVNSLFIDEITSDPQKLMKAAHNYYKGDELFNQMNTFHQIEKAKAVDEAKKTALDGTEVDKERTPFVQNDKLEDNKSEEGAKGFGEE